MAATADSDHESWTQDALGVSIGAINAQVRDELTSPLAYNGPGVVLGFGWHTIGAERIDRVDGRIGWGTLRGLGWTHTALEYTLQPCWAQLASGQLCIGGLWHSSLDIREGTSTSWDARSTLDLAMSWRKPMSAGAHTLLLDVGIATPVVGILGRPGYASEFVGDGFEVSDLQLAAPHNLQGADITARLTWFRPKRTSPARVELRWFAERIAVPHPILSLGAEARVTLYWSL